MIRYNRIFGIGLNKTGTTSVSLALQKLGIRSLHFTRFLKDALAKEREAGIAPPLSSLSGYGALLDHPIESMYRELDKAYPGSKFIYTDRNVKEWLDSREKHVVRNQKDPNYQGTWLSIDKKAWEQQWHSHREAVEKYFEKRPSDILWFNVFEGDGWERLCAFLNCSIPRASFPKANTASKDLWRRSFVVRLIRVVRKNVAERMRQHAEGE